LRTSTGRLVIYNGNDNWYTDSSTPEPNAYDKTVFDNTLDQPFGPAGLPCGVGATGVHMAASGNSGTLGGSIAVTATLTQSNGAAAAGVTVRFTVQSGPNAGATGSVTTGPDGRAIFQYNDTHGAGMDTIVATFTDADGATYTSNTVSVLWTRTGTAVIDASTNRPWSGSETTGASAYDTATVTRSGITPTGNVTYAFFTNGACSGSGSSAGTVALTSAGDVPNSNTESSLAVGAYSFQVVYSGDSNYPTSASSCEMFRVRNPSSVSTLLFDTSTNGVWSGSEAAGASAFDSAILIGVSGITPTGTVTYTFFTNGACVGSGSSAGVVTLRDTGAVWYSNTESLLPVGQYGFVAVYSGDSNYSGSASRCEAFAVSPSGTIGGTVVPVDKVALLAPYLELALAFFVVTITAFHLKVSRRLQASRRKRQVGPLPA